MNQNVILGVVNVVLVFLLSPLLEGTLRKLKAFVHSRVGPPVYQPYLDLLKLLGKEEVECEGTVLFRWSPVVALAAVLSVALLTPVGLVPPLDAAGEVIVFVYLITLSGVAVMASGIGSGSPYGIVGSAREMMLILTVEPVLAIALITVAVKAGSMKFSDILAYQTSHPYSLSMVLVTFSLFMAVLAQLAKLPFDIVEAETEIMEGPFIEQSGPRLALFKWSFYAKELIFASLLATIFFPWPRISEPVLTVVVHLLKIVLLLLIVGVIDAVNPRLRIDQAIRFYGALIFVAFAGLAFAIVGS
ncbi:MAG: NADH-quinone oxidoreductase subunit H [candidate division KSB1 bacterium]|nr:NADH-quinone oxidoreductase subunit H [candidate division KSB1 bacterium]